MCSSIKTTVITVCDAIVRTRTTAPFLRNHASPFAGMMARLVPVISNWPNRAITEQTEAASCAKKRA